MLAWGEKDPATGKDLPGPMDLFVAALESGHTVRDAADFAGVSRSTVYAALQQGLADLNSGELTTVDAQFLDATRKAKARAKFKLVGRVMAAVNAGEWRAAIAMLERRYPKEWGLRQQLQHGIDPKAPTDTVFTLNFGRGPRERTDDGSIVPPQSPAGES